VLRNVRNNNNSKRKYKMRGDHLYDHSIKDRVLRIIKKKWVVDAPTPTKNPKLGGRSLKKNSAMNQAAKIGHN